MLDMIYSVQIIRRTDQCVLSVYLEEFFKLYGIYVYDYVVDEDCRFSISKVSVNIFLTDVSSEYFKRTADYEYRAVEPEGMDTDIVSCVRKILNELFSVLEKHMEQGNILHDYFRGMIDVFMESSYARIDYSRRYFQNQMGEKLLLDTAEAYYGCYQELRKLEQKNITEWNLFPYILAAKLNCAGKINNICMLRKNTPFFDQRVLYGEARKLADADADYSMGNVMAGMLASGVNELWREGIECLNRAVNKEGYNSYMSYVYYFLGQYYEKQKNDPDKAWENYEKILQFSPEYYRAVFKKGCRYLRKNDYRNAYNSFDSIIKMLEPRKHKGWIRPLELEYDYKCHLLNARIKKTFLGDHYGAAQIMYAAEEFTDKVFMNSNFMKLFFDGYLEEYMEFHRIKLLGYGGLL